MRKDPTEFRERFKKWKSGEQVYDKGLPRFGGGKDSYRRDKYNTTHKPYYDTDGTLIYNTILPETVIVPDTQLSPAERNYKERQRQKNLPDYAEHKDREYTEKQTAKAKKEWNSSFEKQALDYGQAIASGIGAGADIVSRIPIYSSLKGASTLSRAETPVDYVESGLWLSPTIGTVGKAAYDTAKPVVNKAINNATVALALRSTQVPEEFLLTKPKVRTKIGDVEIDNPQLSYRLGTKDVVDDFFNSGEVRTPDEDYASHMLVTSKRGFTFDFGGRTFENPMFAQGGLWYGLPQKENAGLLVTAEPLGVANKNSTLLKSKINGTFDVRYPDVGQGGRRVQLENGQLQPSNTTAYLWEPNYGYRRVFTEDAPTAKWPTEKLLSPPNKVTTDWNSIQLPKYEGGKSIHEAFVELMGPSLYNELYRRGIADIEPIYNNMMRLVAGESGHGTSRVAKEYNNFGGVGFNGKSYTKYDSVQSFVKDYVDLIQKRYPDAMKNITPTLYAHVLKKGGYYQAPEAEYARTMSNMPTLLKYMTAHRKAHPDMYGEVKTLYPMRTSREYDDPKPQSILDSKPSYSQPSYGSTYKDRLYPVKTVQLPEVVITGDKEKSKFALPTIADMIKPQPYSEYMRDYFQQILGVPKLYAPHQLMQ